MPKPKFSLPIFYGVFGVLSLLLSGCASCCSHKGCDSSVQSFDNYSDYFCHWTSSTKLPVYVCDGTQHPKADTIDSNQPAVLLLHELPGMTPQCLSLATNIAAHHYTVYVPLMFGNPLDNHPCLYFFRLWASCQWYLFHENATSRIVKKLRIIEGEIKAHQNIKPMGVIGMCLTGAFPLALMSDTNVQAVVLSQPANPMGFTEAQKRALGLSARDLDIARKRVAQYDIPILAFRFETDSICTPEKFETLSNVFQSHFKDRTIHTAEYPAPHPCCNLHSVLCEQYDNTEGSATRERFEEVITNFDIRLKHNNQ